MSIWLDNGLVPWKRPTIIETIKQYIPPSKSLVNLFDIYALLGQEMFIALDLMTHTYVTTQSERRKGDIRQNTV